MSNILYCYYEINKNEFRVYNPWTNSHSTMNLNELNQLQKKYEMFRGYEISDEGLQRYYMDFRKWNDELKLGGLGIQFTYYYKHKYAVLGAFNNNTTFQLKDQEIIDKTESKYFEMCNNGGLIYCLEGSYNCYGYDFNSFYPRVLGEEKYNFKFPIRSGYETNLNELDPNNIKFGFYRVKIECANSNFNKMFNFNPKDVYTSDNLKFAYQYQEEFKIKIILLCGYDFNAYLYNEEDLISSHQVFGDWFNKLSTFRKKYPKNKLVKHLLSSLWGQLSAYKKVHVKKSDLNNYDWGTDESFDYSLENSSNNKTNDYYTLIELNNRYQFNIRLKPFLISFARNIMGHIAYNNNLDKIIRVMTDNITYKSNVYFNVENMLPEEKTTGRINFKNAMRYNKI